MDYQVIKNHVEKNSTALKVNPNPNPNPNPTDTNQTNYLIQSKKINRPLKDDNFNYHLLVVV